MHSLVQLNQIAWRNMLSHGPKPSIETKQNWTKKSLQCTSSLATYRTYDEHISNMIKGFWNHNRGLWVAYGYIMSRQPRAPSYCYLPIKWDINSIAIGSQGPEQRRHFTVHRLWRRRNQALSWTLWTTRKLKGMKQVSGLCPNSFSTGSTRILIAFNDKSVYLPVEKILDMDKMNKHDGQTRWKESWNCVFNGASSMSHLRSFPATLEFQS